MLHIFIDGDACPVKQEVLTPAGKPFTSDNIGPALASRDLMASLRDAGAVTGVSRQDRSRFLMELERAVQSILRSQP